MQEALDLSFDRLLMMTRNYNFDHCFCGRVALFVTLKEGQRMCPECLAEEHIQTQVTGIQISLEETA